MQAGARGFCYSSPPAPRRLCLTREAPPRLQAQAGVEEVAHPLLFTVQFAQQQPKEVTSGILDRPGHAPMHEGKFEPGIMF